MFFEVQVTERPVSLAVLLGRTGSPWDTDESWLFRGRVHSRGPQTAYRTVAGTEPDPAAVRGYRHPAGSEVRIEVWGADASMAWFWTGTGTATLVFEDMTP